MAVRKLKVNRETSKPKLKRKLSIRDCEQGNLVKLPSKDHFDEKFKRISEPLTEEEAIETTKREVSDELSERRKKKKSRILTKVLVNIIFNFCLAYSGIELYPYQAQFGKRIIRSLLMNDGDEITALFSRQSGKSETVSIITGGCSIILPVLANLPMFANDERLAKFKHGIMIGIFAPSLNQAQIVFGRSKKRMGSEEAEAVMSDPEINVNFDISNGQNVMLSHGSLIRCQSASDNANIEGDSYHLIIVDESQDVGNFKYRKSISPMGAFHNATKVLIGTPSNRKGFFHNSIQRNKEEYKENPKKRNHFEYNYEVVCKYNPNYAKYIEGEKKRLGERSDEFKMSYNLEWILSRGMFMTDEALDKLKSEVAKFSRTSQATCVAGIDLGKSKDNTIISIGIADFENPILIEKSVDNPEDTFEAFNVELIALYDLGSMDWEDQYYEIIDILSRYNIVKLTIDATGVGSPIYSRIVANTRYNVEPYVYSTPSKSALYKHFDGAYKGGRLTIPMEADELTVAEYLYDNMERQLLDLQKFYRGQHMVCQHPDEQGAHDDIPDAMALMMWSAKERPAPKLSASTGSPYKSTKQKSFYKTRNKKTSRRRAS